MNSKDLDLCRQAVKERNRLIHHFFRTHAENFVTPAGKQMMLDDLTEIAELLQQADAANHRLFMSTSEKFGITKDIIDNTYDAMLSRIKDEERS